MPEMTKYDHGVPSWADIGTPDPQAALKFYGTLFGWEGADQGEEAGHYTICTKNGKNVAAISPAQDPGPPRWTTYVNVDNVDDVAKKAEAAGGTVVLPAMDVMGAGRMAIFQDTTGAFIAVWQPNQHIGAELVNEPGTMIWNELATGDLAKSKAFYGETFGWTFGGAAEYAEGQVHGRTVAGIQPRPEMLPKEVPDHWLVYFASDDVDKSTKQVTKLGGTVLVEPMDIPQGRFSVVMDPQGAAFGIYKG